MGEMVRFGKRPDAAVGYQVASQRAGPGVLVIPEVFGLTPHFKSFADRLNLDELFTVVAFDLYDGTTAAHRDEAVALRDSLDRARVIAKLEAAAEHLTANWHPRLGVVGFSLGAAYAVALAQTIEIEATVVYYGLDDVDPARWHGPVLGHFSANDDAPDPAEAKGFTDAVLASGEEAEMHVYGGVEHGFANQDRPGSFDAAPAELAYRRTCDFLRHHLA
jgi:carboxymethylenebutenolidase